MIDLSIAACRKRQSPRTHFVHNIPDTISFFENFCFAFALFRQRTKEAFLEGKEIFERLLAFQTPDGNFPVYLHDYPRCFDRFFPLKIAPIFVHALRYFPQQLKTEAFERLLAYAKDLGPLPPLWEMRRKALFGEETFFEPQTASEWFEWIVSKQLLTKDLTAEIPYSQALQTFLGEHTLQEGPEPQPVPIEWLLAEKENFSPRLLRDHLHQIHAALLFPVKWKESSKVQKERFLWGGSKIHSLFFPNGTSFELLQEDLEMSLYCDLSPETTVLINGKKGTVFHLGDEVSIVTPTAQIAFKFQLLEGKGDFVGHLSRANRPGQLCKEEVYDWKIELRTLRREGRCLLKLSCNH